MTVLVGFHCKDGVVIGTDSAATFGHGGRTQTISQPTAKIEIIGDRVIVATTGAVGLGQRFRHHVECEWNEKGFQKGCHAVSTSITRRTLQDFQSTGVPNRPQTGFEFGAIVAAPIGETHCLTEYDTVTFQPETKTESIPFVSMGSGQLIADPFLGFVRRTFWRDGLPTTHEGVFATVWALTHTIELAPGLVGSPVRVAVLERADKGRWAARELDEDEIGRHQEHCEAVEEHLAEYKPKLLGESDTEDVPDVPEIPSE